MAKKQILSIVSNILDEYLPKEGYSLYHTDFAKEGRDWYLRIFVDKEDGPMGTDDCEKVSRYLSERLDKEDPIEQNYFLVVSSPGIDRELITDKHFEMYMGYDVDVNLYKALEGEKTITGKLTGYDDGTVSIERDGSEINLSKKEISKIRLTVKI